jgi:hypothetical protein
MDSQTLFKEALAAMLLAFVVLPAAHGDVPPKDYKNIDLTKHHIPAVAAKKDAKTGFVVGGTNSTELIRKLTEINGLTIATLEKTMRPGKSSSAGFLGKEEKLLEVMAADNKTVVDELGLTHQDLARPMHAMGAVALLLGKTANAPPVEFIYEGRRFKVKRSDTRGRQPSPFDDDTASGSNALVHNLDSGKKIGYGLLVPFMVERYGFYEGKGTPYRVEPRQVVEVFDFLKAKATKKQQKS